MDLTWCGHVDLVIGLEFNLVSWWQESVKPHDEVWVTFKKLGHTVDDSRSVNAVEIKQTNHFYQLGKFKRYTVSLYDRNKIRLLILKKKEEIMMN